MSKSKKPEKGARGAFFSHDAHTDADGKMKMLYFRYGMRGKGWFFTILEAMRREEEDNYSLKMGAGFYDWLAEMLSTSCEPKIAVDEMKEFVTHCIGLFELFQIDQEGRLYSASLLRRMQIMENARDNKRAAGNASAAKRAEAEENPKAPATGAQQEGSTDVTESNKYKRKQIHKPKQKLKDYSLFQKEDIENLSAEEAAAVIFAGCEEILKDARALDLEIQSAWLKFMSSRKLKRKPVSEGAAESLWQKMWTYGHQRKDLAMKVLQESIDNSWQGLFPLKHFVESNQSQQKGIGGKYASVANAISGS